MAWKYGDKIDGGWKQAAEILKKRNRPKSNKVDLRKEIDEIKKAVKKDA